VNARYRPDGGAAEGLRCDAAMPPASRNHRVPTAGDTPAPAAASSLERPAAIAAQNRRRAACRPTEGRPGERSMARPAPSERRLRVVIATPSGAMLRRPIEFTQHRTVSLGQPAILLTRPHRTARHSQLPKLDIAARGPGGVGGPAGRCHFWCHFLRATKPNWSPSVAEAGKCELVLKYRKSM
jgi:hypothetical protein